MSESKELSTVLAGIQAFTAEGTLDNAPARADLLGLAKRLTTLLEDPVNRATDLVFKPYTSVAARIAVDLDLFHHISSASTPISAKELSSTTKAESQLISRVLRLLASVGFVDETGENQWAANDTTRAMATPPIAAGHRFVYDVLITSAMAAPKFLRETQHKVPDNPRDGFIQYAHQTKFNAFEYLHSLPPLLRDFHLFMGNTMGAREYWHDWYDVQGRLLEGFDPSKNQAVLVDIGGGKGHDVNSFYSAFMENSTEQGRKVVLQDLPHVIEAIPHDQIPPAVVKMSHDFFKEQPVKGARGYFLHHILHDWPDNYCHEILGSLKKAMIPGYSKLLIHELILPDTGAVEIQARFDLVMMTFGAGAERSRSQWTKLLEEAGFCNIVLHEHLDHDGIVEAEVAP